MSEPLKITLPWPPSTNGYWRSFKGRQILSKNGRIYKVMVAQCIAMQNAKKMLTGRLDVAILLHPPDKRRRDIDNFGGKALLDALCYGGVYLDDSQIDILYIERGEIHKGGMVEIYVTEIIT